MNTKSKYAIYKVVFETDKKKPCRMYINSEKQNLVASFYDDPETVAMFQLFAAAPEMLEALEALLESAIQAEHFEHNSYNPPTEIHEMMANGDFSKRIFNAIAAIAKAKGEQP